MANNFKKNQFINKSKIAHNETMDLLLPFSTMDVIQNVEKIRKKSNPYYTQKELAENSGIAISTYKTYLNGMSNNLSLKTVQHFARLLNVDLSVILKRYDE